MSRPLPITCRTGKRGYRDELDAMIALATQGGRGAERRAKNNARVYRCPHCHRWHLTSQARRAR